ncbi:MAG: hypothetical protein Q9194_002261 [Teloschistes cf. exilis]
MFQKLLAMSRWMKQEQHFWVVLQTLEKKQHASPQPPSLPKFSLPAPTASSAPKTKTDLSTPRPSLVAEPPLFEPPSSNSTPASTTPFTTPTKSTGKPWTLAREACTIHHFHFEDLNDPEQML